MALGITQIQMYCTMIEQEFAPVIKILNSRTANIKPIIEQQVKKDWGIYELCAEKAALTLRMKEIDNRVNEFVSEYREYDSRGGEYIIRSKVNDEVTARLHSMNEPLRKVEAQRDNLLKEVKLSIATKEVKALFEKLPAEIGKIMAEVASLPKIEAPKERKRIGK